MIRSVTGYNTIASPQQIEIQTPYIRFARHVELLWIYCSLSMCCGSVDSHQQIVQVEFGQYETYESESDRRVPWYDRWHIRTPHV